MITFENASRFDYRPHFDDLPRAVPTAPIWARIWARKGFIALLTVVLFGLSLALLVVLPRWYTASSEIVVEQRPQGVDLAAVLSRMPTDSQAVLTEAEALSSRTLVQRTIEQLDLLSNPEFNPRIIPNDGSLRSLWRQARLATMTFIETLLPRDRQESAGDPVMNEATEIFVKNLRVKPIGRSQVLKASFTSESPELAARILNTLVGFYLAAQMENRVAIPTKMGDFLKGELDRLQVQVRQSNEAVERYRNEAELQKGIVQGREALLYTQDLGEANRELIAVRVKRQDIEARLRQIRANPDSFSDVLSSSLIQQLRKQMSLLKDERSQLAASYGPSFPRLRQVEASIADSERRLRVEIAKIVHSLEGDLAVQTEREAQLAQSIADVKDKMRGLGDARVKLASLEQQAEVNRSMLNTFLTQYTQLTSQRSLQIADSYVLSRAVIPTLPSFPPLVPFLGLAFVASVGLSVLWAVLRDRTGETIRSSQEVQPLLTARALGVIPKLSGKTSLLTQVISSPQSPFTESIRIVLSRFMATRNLGRAVMVASAQPHEGRTSLAIAVARLAALSGRRTILIDCDLRRPALHTAFAGGQAPGLTDVLEGRMQLDAAIRRDAVTPLDYIAAGELAPHAANLLCLPEMTELLAKLRVEYDLLILDSPPSATVADAICIAEMADECMFVVSWNKTRWRLARDQMEELAQHCSVTGVVLNQVDMAKHLKYHSPYVDPVRVPGMIGVG